MEDIFKKIMLLGIGTMAASYEKASSLVNDLVEKGQITLNQGKQLNEELKRVINDEGAKADLDIKSYIDSLNLATKSDIDNLARRIEELEKKINGGN